MTNSEIVTLLLTSTVVSGLVAFLLNYFFESRQQHRFERGIADLEHNYAIQLEELKAEMVIGADLQHELTERRLSSYPKLVELVYRTRNMARELVDVNLNPVFVEELEARSIELEDCLYKFRIDLERDHIFGPIHAYKNLLKNFNLALKDMMLYQSRDTLEDEVQQVAKQLKSTYNSIETLHNSIINKLSESADNKPA